MTLLLQLTFTENYGHNFTNGCFEPQEDERIIIDNNAASLSHRIEYVNEVVVIDTLGVLPKALQWTLADTIILTLVAEVTPPVYNGDTLQATDVIIHDRKVYISYNIRGDTFLGGVDVFDINDITTPQLISSAVFTDTEVNGLTEQGGTLYLASATERPDFASPAVLEMVTLSGGLLTDQSTTIDVPSYAATDVEVAAGRIYVTSGTAGGYVSILDARSFNLLNSIPVEDARGVSADKQDVGVGTGSTVYFFIEALAGVKDSLVGAVASSAATAERLQGHNIPVLDLNEVGEVALYVDGADEADHRLRLIKGGGGALTWEKIVATASRRFVCIVDETKLVKALGAKPIPVEVLPMALRYVSGVLAAMGGKAVVREGFVTDNSNLILDVHGLAISDPARLEAELDHIPGVVGNGLFAHRPADVLLVGTGSGVRKFDRT